MVRVVKEYDERMNELLDTAQKLFFGKGYDQTSVNDIIEMVGVAKGTFYYYFKSKDELLNKLVVRFSDQIMKNIRPIIAKKDINALDKFNEVMAVSRNMKAANKELMILFLRLMYKDENLIIRHRIFKDSIKTIAPELTKIIKQGVEEGIFNTPYPEDVTELIFILAEGMREKIAEYILKLDEEPGNIDIIIKTTKMYEHTVERILGVKEGSIKMLDMEFFDAFK